MPAVLNTNTMVYGIATVLLNYQVGEDVWSYVILALSMIVS